MQSRPIPFGTYLVLLAAATAPAAGVRAADGKIGEDFPQGGYKLVWADEFDEDGAPNAKNWCFEQGFVRNHEAQWYQPENAQCKDGRLYITAREDIKRNPGYVKGSTDWTEAKFIEFTSSSLMTKGLHNWTMGRFVMKAKIPHGQGMWPAFWMVGENGEWPSSGEIDIMEYYQDKLLANVAHGTAKRWNARWHGKSISTGELGGETWLNQFHVWRMDWDAESIRLYIDDRLINQVPLADTNNVDPRWGPQNPFHHPHYIIVNLALGGDNGGEVVLEKLPAEFVIDYVRVYQRDEDKSFRAPDKYIPPPPYTGKKVGIHHFSEYPKSINKKCGWESGCDSYSYAWKPQGSDRESAEMIADYDDKLEGELSYKLVLNHGWSRWVVEMDPKYGDGVANYSDFEKLGFGIQSKDADNWESFRIIIESADGRSYEAPLTSLGFKPDGEWHRCTIDLSKVEQRGVDLTKIKVLLAIAWEGGVNNGDYFKLDDVYLE